MVIYLLDLFHDVAIATELLVLVQLQNSEGRSTRATHHTHGYIYLDRLQLAQQCMQELPARLTNVVRS